LKAFRRLSFPLVAAPDILILRREVELLISI
jgi:hypothetical protein